jgi:hypothetical protein
MQSSNNLSNVETGFSAIDMCANGTRLVTASIQGYAVIYTLNNSSSSWQVESIVDFPIETDSVPVDREEMSIALSGHCQRLALGMSSRGKVYTFNYNVLGPIAWVRHVQPIFEDQNGDGTGTSIDFSYDGEVLVVGAPRFSGRQPRNGQIRTYNFNGVAWSVRSFIEGDRFGDSVGALLRLSTDATTMVSGSAQVDTPNGARSGSIWSWTRSGIGLWQTKSDQLWGPSSLNRFGHQISLSHSGRVMAVSTPGYATGVVFVYEYSENDSNWINRGSPIPVPGTDQPGLCLSTDGNAVAVATVNRVRVFQYGSADRNEDGSTSLAEWVPVGNSFASGDEGSRQVLACSADLRMIALLRSTPDYEISKISVYRGFD